MAQKKKIFVGGLFPSVSEDELKNRFSKFGNIQNVDIRIRKDNSGSPIKTFAYIDGDFTESNLKKCFSVYNKNKWKGSELSLQLAKESFLEKLKKERELNEKSRETYQALEDKPVQPSPMPVKELEVKGAVPGTLIPGEKNWVVGKYSRALPIVYIRRKDKRKIAKMDPSKFCHNVKRIKESENEDRSITKLTWEMEEANTEILNRVQGNFPEFHPPRKEKSELKKSVTAAMEVVREKLTSSQTESYENDDSDDSLEVVKVNPLPKGLTLKEKMERIAGMDVSHAFQQDVESDDSAATDEIIESSKHNSSVGDKSSSLMLSKYGNNLSASYNPDSRPKRQKVQQDNSIGSRKKQTVVEEKLTENNFQNSALSSRKAKGNVFQKGKPPPFLGTKQLRNSSTLNKKSDIVIKTSSKSKKDSMTGDTVQSDSINKPNMKIKGKQISKGTPKKSTVLYNSSSDSDDEMGGISEKDFLHRSFNNNLNFKTKECRVKMDNSVLMNEYSSGLLPERMASDKQDSSRSDSDYDSEDYEKLAQKVPKGNQFISRPSDISVKESSDDDDTDNSENLSEMSEMEDSRPSQILSPNLSAIKKKKITSREGNAKSTSVVTMEENSDEDACSIEDSECLQKSDSNRFHMQSTSTPLPVNSSVKGINSSHETLEESSLSLDEFSTRFLAKAGDMSSSSSDSSDSDNSTLPDESMNKTFERHSPLKKTERINLDTNKNPINLKSKDCDFIPTVKKLSKNIPSQKPNVEVKAANTKLTPEKIVLEKDVSKTKSLLKHTSDNQKRLEALRQRKKETISQKSAVQEALKTVDSAPKGNKKIVFSSDDEDVVTVSKLAENLTDIEQEEETSSIIKSSKMMRKTRLFASSSDESSEESSTGEDSDAEMFQIKPQFQGEAGKKLMNLQARFGNDPRFKLDQRFLDTRQKEDTADVNVTEEESEKDRMMKILRDVVGAKLPQETDNSKKQFKGPVRYDPSKEDHKQFEVKSEVQKKIKITQLSDESVITREKTAEQLAREIVPEVSKDRFYQISSSLTDTFRKADDAPSSSGFSLLAAFGRPEEDLEIDNKQSQEEVELPKAASVFPWQHQLVQDSSDEENEELMEEDRLKDRTNEKSPEKKTADVTIPQTFFFKPDDPRLKEGIEFFCRHGDPETIREKWLEERPRLIESYRSVHRRVSRRVRLSQSKRGRRSSHYLK